MAKSVFGQWGVPLLLALLLVVVSAADAWGLLSPRFRAPPPHRQPATERLIRPQYPAQFISNWTYELTGPDGTVAAGWTLWSGANETLYYYMSAYGGWEQIVQGTRIFNFCRKIESCCYDDYGFPIVQNYFDNATLIGALPNDPGVLEWVGSLYTQPIFGANVTYIVRTQVDTGYPIMYVSANVVDDTLSEIMFLLHYALDKGPLVWYTVPSYCTQPCGPDEPQSC
jgi:hypothetical protein